MDGIHNNQVGLISLEDILSWLKTGEIEGVFYDEASIIEAIEAELGIE